MLDPASLGFGMSIPKRWGAGTQMSVSPCMTEMAIFVSKNFPFEARDRLTMPRHGGYDGRSSRRRSIFNWRSATQSRAVQNL